MCDHLYRCAVYGTLGTRCVPVSAWKMPPPFPVMPSPKLGEIGWKPPRDPIVCPLNEYVSLQSEDLKRLIRESVPMMLQAFPAPSAAERARERDLNKVLDPYYDVGKHCKVAGVTADQMTRQQLIALVGLMMGKCVDAMVKPGVPS